jgi:hypothetical protein
VQEKYCTVGLYARRLNFDDRGVTQCYNLRLAQKLASRLAETTLGSQKAAPTGTGSRARNNAR